MASSRTKDKAITFTHPIQVRVRQLPIKYFASLRNLDIKKLSVAKRAEIELGFIKTSCCEQIVRAIVRHGKVAEVKVDSCTTNKKPQRLPKEMKRLLDAAHKKSRRIMKGPPRLPVPVKTFLAQAQERRGITVITCAEICFLWWCIDCCQQPSGDWVCGRLTIDTTTGPYIPVD